MDQPDEEACAPRYNSPQQHQTFYVTYYASTEDEKTRQSYEQSRYKRSRERVKRKELEILGLEREESLKHLREQEFLEKFRIHDEREKRKSSGYDDGSDKSYQVNNEQNLDLESNQDAYLEKFIRCKLLYNDDQVERERYERAKLEREFEV